MFLLDDFFKVNQKFFLRTFLVFIVAIFLWEVQGILMPFVVGLILAYFLEPLYFFLQRHKFPAAVARLLIVLVLTFVVLLLMSILFPFFVDQLIQAYQGVFIIFWKQSLLPILQKISLPGNLNLLDILGKIGERFLSSFSGTASAVANVFWDVLGSVIQWILVPVTTYYFLRDGRIIRAYLYRLFGIKARSGVSRLLGRVEHKLKRYLWGIGLDISILATYYTIVFFILGLPYFLALGFLAGTLNIFPYVGVFLTYLLALLVGFNVFHSYWILVAITGVYGVGYLLDSYILQPYVVGRSLGLSPNAVIFAVMAGATLWGITGVLIALPLTGIFLVVFTYLLARTRK